MFELPKTDEERVESLILHNREVNIYLWQLLINDYYACCIDWSEYELVSGKKYGIDDLIADRDNCWNNVFYIFISNPRYLAISAGLFKTFSEQIEDIKENGFDRNKHLDVEYVGYHFHFPSAYDTIDEIE